jgi:hypothetical protein
MCMISDVSLGPIEQANRMALAPAKRMLPFLEFKDSFPKVKIEILNVTENLTLVLASS